MEDQNNDEATKLLKVLGKALGSFGLLVEFFEGINGKKMSLKQKQILSKVTGLTPTIADLSTNAHCDDTNVGQGRGVAYPREQATVPGETIASNPYVNEQTSWLFNFNFVDEVGDVFLVVTDKNSMNWVGIRWTPEGIIVYNKTGGYVEKYTDSYHQYNLTAYPSIRADVVINFNGNTTPFKAETTLSLVEDGEEYRLLASMKIGGVMEETPLIHTHLGVINQSPVLTSLLTRLEAQNVRQQFTQQPPFNSFNPQQPYGSQPSFGPNPYPPQQPYGQDITLHEMAHMIDSESGNIEFVPNRLDYILYKFNLGDFDPTPTPTKETMVKRDYELKVEYIDGGVNITVKHPGGEYVKKFDNIRQELFNKFIVQTKHIQTGYDETKYRRYWETEHGKLLLVIFDVKNPATDTIEESFVKVYFTNNNIAIETSLIPHTSSPTTNPNKEVVMQKDYKIDAEYICDYITISVKNNGEEYIETINNIRHYLSYDNIEYIQPENGFEERKYNLVRDTKHGFHFVIKIHDLVNKATGDISKSYLKVDLITDDYQTITTPFIPRKEPQMSENQDKYHDGGSFADDENFQEEPIGPDTGSNGDLASLEAKINELTELVLNQHRVITHMGNTMSILHGDLMRLISHYRPTTPYYPQQQPPATPGFYPQPPATPVYPPHQPPFTPGSYPQQPKPSFNPQQQQPTATKEEIKDQPNFRSNFLK